MIDDFPQTRVEGGRAAPKAGYIISSYKVQYAVGYCTALVLYP